MEKKFIQFSCDEFTASFLKLICIRERCTLTALLGRLVIEYLDKYAAGLAGEFRADALAEKVNENQAAQTAEGDNKNEKEELQN